jgi:hypothetical protein
MWIWPVPKDEIFYTCNNIVKHIEPPVVSGSQGQFLFLEKF